MVEGKGKIIIVKFITFCLNKTKLFCKKRRKLLARRFLVYDKMKSYLRKFGQKLIIFMQTKNALVTSKTLIMLTLLLPINTFH